MIDRDGLTSALSPVAVEHFVSVAVYCSSHRRSHRKPHRRLHCYRGRGLESRADVVVVGSRRI
jgi:hypothetical protein